MNRYARPLAACVLALSLVASGCKQKSTGKPGGPAASGSAAGAELPPLVLRDDTPNLLLTWVDEQGDFHVAEHVADVPEAGRAEVRVVVADRPDGTSDTVYVADLRSKQADGSYPVKALPRKDWDEIGASKRKTRLEALAPSAAPPPAASGPSSIPAGEVTAIIYGASWCGPCHEAEALLKSLGVKVTKKDIEESAEAEHEMEEKLRRAHRRGGSIPVIDVMGQIFVGFSAGTLRDAVDRARRGQTL
jgi:glutaredoxin